MSDERVAEFLSLDDCKAFWRMKGRDDYHVCGGINMPWAVRRKSSHEIGLGDPTQPPKRVNDVDEDDDDDVPEHGEGR